LNLKFWLQEFTNTLCDLISLQEPYNQLEVLQHIMYLILLQVGTTNPTATLWVVDLSRPSNLSQVDLKPSSLLKYDLQAEW
jgi:hypothetical protein